MGKDTHICSWFDRKQHDSCFTGFSIEIANETLASMYGTYLYPKQKGNNIHSDKPCLYTAFSKFVPSAGSQPGSRLVQSGTAPPTPRQLHQFTPRKKWGVIFSVTHQNYEIREKKNPTTTTNQWCAGRLGTGSNSAHRVLEEDGSECVPKAGQLDLCVLWGPEVKIQPFYKLPIAACIQHGKQHLIQQPSCFQPV